MTNDNHNPAPLHRAARWMFADRTTGQIVIGQWPNVPLWIFLAAWLTNLLIHPTGTIGRVVTIVAAAALTVWALDELIRGVCPWRRILGGIVLAVEVVGWARLAWG